MQLYHTLFLLSILVSLTKAEISFWDWLFLKPAVCYASFLWFDFDVGDQSRYTNYFRDDSVAILAQTGNYIGPDAIAEYTAYASETSPFITSLSLGPNGALNTLVDINDGICEFLSVRENVVTFDPATTLGNEATFVYMLKLFYKPSWFIFGGYLERMNIFFTRPFAKWYFEQLDTAQSRSYICGVMQNECKPILGDSVDDTCETVLAGLRVCGGEEGECYADGDTQSCRSLHVAFAATNSFHCPHLSFDGMPDDNGDIKCQTSELVSPESLFTEEDLGLYAEFAESTGIDSTQGFVSTIAR